jgi:hypothetical protein
MERIDRSSKGHYESDTTSRTAIAQPFRTLLITNYRYSALTFLPRRSWVLGSPYPLGAGR